MYSASIVITTKNRKYELAKALESCLLQKGDPEILVFDDGSDDDTFDFVRVNYPMVRLHREEQSLGIVNARNKAAALVKGEIIFSIDDDAFFSSDDIVTTILADFDHPQVGAVAIPLINKGYGDEITQIAPHPEEIYYNQQYMGTAHALKRELFIQLGGYAPWLVRQGEEMDYCIRMFAEGYRVKLGFCKPIIHSESNLRDRSVIKYYEARNYIIFILRYSPLLILLPYLCVTFVNLIRKREGMFDVVTKGICDGLSDFRTDPAIKRNPLSIKLFLQFKFTPMI